MKKKTKIRIIAIVVCVVYSFVMSCPAFFIVKETGHGCIGRKCAVCEKMRYCADAINAATMTKQTLFIMLIGIMRLFFLHQRALLRIKCDTPVSLKVKLSD